MAKFGTFQFGEELFGSGGASGASTVLVRVPWIFTEIYSPDEYEFAINPLNATMPSREKTVTAQSTAAGNQVLFQGRSKPQHLDFSGTILTETHYNKMREWSSKQKQVQIMDDLARRYWVYIISFNPKRRYKPEYPWMHEFSCESIVLDWGIT